MQHRIAISQTGIMKLNYEATCQQTNVVVTPDLSLWFHQEFHPEPSQTVHPDHTHITVTISHCRTHS